MLVEVVVSVTEAEDLFILTGRPSLCAVTCQVRVIYTSKEAVDETETF